MNNNNTSLRRSISLPVLTFYGLGNILGAGIYVLVGKVAGVAGYLAPLAFFIASLIAAVSALTYAEMSARYPVSAGEAVYINEGFHRAWLASLVGIMIALAGMVSAAAISIGFVGYFQVFLHWPAWLVIALLLGALGLVAAWGINQSMALAVSFTLVEMLGLVLVILYGLDDMPRYFHKLAQHPPSLSPVMLTSLFSGAFLAFYAYIGFEDMVNVVEEVKQPEKNMPRGILASVVISTLLYAGVTLVCLSVMSPEQLSSSHAPLADVYLQLTREPPWVISAIGMFAVVNGALIQIIMASRLLYGMARKGWLPDWLGQVSERTRTPVNATVVVVLMILLLALSVTLVGLAELTSYLVLMVFALVNLALVSIKRRGTVISPYSVAGWVPMLGFLTTLLLLLFQLLHLWIT